MIINKIRAAVTEALDRLGIVPQVDVTLTRVREPEYGDYSTNIAMILARQLRQDPVILATQIADAIDTAAYDIKTVRVAGRGFINIYVNNQCLAKEIDLLLESPQYGGQRYQGTILIEYVSANPTGYMHVGHARNAVVGMILANTLEYLGYKVVREYYVNDAGRQIRQLADSVHARYCGLLGIAEKPTDITYIGEDIRECAQALIAKYGREYLNAEPEETRKAIAKFSTDYFLVEIKRDLETIGCIFDNFTSEQSLYDNGHIDAVFAELRESNQIYQSNGAWLLRSSTDEEDDKDRVVCRSDGSHTYIMPDIAYHLDKLTRYSDLVSAINIWGSDHSGYVTRLRYGIRSLGVDVTPLKFLMMQQVRLLQDGREVKMSKRAATTIWMRDFIRQLGTDQAIYMLVNRSINSVVDIDINMQVYPDNPVYVIQYSYARAVQMLLKLAQKRRQCAHITEPLVQELAKLILSFPEVLEDVARTLKCELLSSYAHQLARAFNSLYSQLRVMGHQQETSILAVIEAYKIVQGQVMELLGLTRYERIDIVENNSAIIR